jgi:DNA-binding beta-propeller fold protein YncE
MAGVLAIASSAVGQQLIAIDSNRAISVIDVNTGARAVVATATSNASTAAGLAYDLGTQTLYLTSTGNDSLYTLDVRTGTATLVGAYGSSAFVMHGLEIDASTGNLYGVSSHDNGLYQIDKATGVPTLIGTTGLTSFTNLCYDLLTAQMYCTNSGTDSFYSINLATGAVTLIGPLSGPTNPNGLAYHPATGQIYMVCNSTDRLYSIDRATGAATAIGPAVSSNLLGLAYVSNVGDITRQAHACGNVGIQTSGLPVLGANISTSVTAGAGVTFLGYGLNVNAQPFCGCTIGHDWSVQLLGASHSFTLPTDPAFVGVSIGVQAAELFGTGGCPAPQVSFSDTMVVTIG